MQINREARFSCKCAFFVVPLQRIWLMRLTESNYAENKTNGISYKMAYKLLIKRINHSC